ncbi:hypothetical protein [Ralstonia pseudosolanacearum]|uniref:hypothetical protein n=1 Tax=Ralstonia pseudosolanacearum TaxID=1310165 RepID=UPI003CE8276F
MKNVIHLLSAVACCALALPALAVDLNDTVSMVAQTHQTTLATINGRDAQVIYVGQFGGCESVAIRSSGDHFQHFRVCGGQVEPRNTVAPKWPDDQSGKRVLSAVVQNAILYGQASQGDENGYQITARTLGTVEASCKNVEVLISYDGDLVDRGLKKICGNR